MNGLQRKGIMILLGLGLAATYSIGLYRCGYSAGNDAATVKMQEKEIATEKGKAEAAKKVIRKQEQIQPAVMDIAKREEKRRQAIETAPRNIANKPVPNILYDGLYNY